MRSPVPPERIPAPLPPWILLAVVAVLLLVTGRVGCGDPVREQARERHADAVMDDR